MTTAPGDSTLRHCRCRRAVRLVDTLHEIEAALLLHWKLVLPHLWRCLAVVCALLVFGQPVSAQPNAAAAAEPRWRESGAWRQPDGLPQDSVITILQTRDGYIWLGTRAGVSLFDAAGVRFTPLATHRDQASSCGRTKSGLSSRATTGPLDRRLRRRVEPAQGRALHRVRGEGRPRRRFVRLLLKDPAGALWIGMDHGVSRFEDGAFTRYTVKEGLRQAPCGAPPRGGRQRPRRDARAPQRIAARPHRAGRAARDDTHSLTAIDRCAAIGKERSGSARPTACCASRTNHETHYTTAQGLSSNAVRVCTKTRLAASGSRTTAGLDLHTGTTRRPPASCLREPGRVERHQRPCTATAGRPLGRPSRPGLARFHQGIFSSYSSSDGLPDSG